MINQRYLVSMEIKKLDHRIIRLAHYITHLRAVSRQNQGVSSPPADCYKSYLGVPNKLYSFMMFSRLFTTLKLPRMP